MDKAIPPWYALKCADDGYWPLPFGRASLGILFVEVLFLAGLRDTAKVLHAGSPTI